jgi:hypothetical protein
VVAGAHAPDLIFFEVRRMDLLRHKREQILPANDSPGTTDFG